MADSVAPRSIQRVKKSFFMENFSYWMKNCKPGQYLEQDSFNHCVNQCVNEDLLLEDGSIKMQIYFNGVSEEIMKQGHGDGVLKGMVVLGMRNEGEEEVTIERCRITMAGKTKEWKMRETIPAKEGKLFDLILTHEECLARLKSGALKVTVELDLPTEADCQENSLIVVKKNSELDPEKVTVGQNKKKKKKKVKKVGRDNDGISKGGQVDKKISTKKAVGDGISEGSEVEEKVQSKKKDSEMEEAALGYHEIVIDLRLFHLICSACKARPRRCAMYQCSAGHLVCPACLPSLQRCAVCNTSLPEPPCRNLCAEQCIASIGEVD